MNSNAVTGAFNGLSQFCWLQQYIHEHIMFIRLLLVETFNLKFRGYHPWDGLKKKFVASSSEFPCGKGGFKMESCVNVIIMTLLRAN